MYAKTILKASDIDNTLLAMALSYTKTIFKMVSMKLVNIAKRKEGKMKKVVVFILYSTLRIFLLFALPCLP